MKCKSISAPLLGLLLLLFAAVQIYACTIPVFRYALDKWRPDSYGLSISKEWLETKPGRDFVDSLDELPIHLEVVPSDKAEGKVGLMLPAAGSPEVWEGPTDFESIRKLVDSPARRKIAKDLLAGNSVVWVLVLSGDKEVDLEFETNLTKRLKYLEQVAAIPPQDPFDPESQLGPGPELRVGFSLIKVMRDDSREKLLVRMLAGPDSEDLIASKEPFASPIFGRGRALGAWAASDLDDEGIDELTLFLLGACSCQVKAQNPGWDILMATDWDAGLMKVAMALEAKAEEAYLLEAEPEPTTEAEVVKSGSTEQVEHSHLHEVDPKPTKIMTPEVVGIASAEPDEEPSLPDPEPEPTKITQPELVKSDSADPEPTEFMKPEIVKFGSTEPSPEALLKVERAAPSRGVLMGIGLLVVLVLFGFFTWRRGL